MNKSEQINELASSLSALQGEIIDAYKDREGYGYRYADLSAVLEIARPLMTKHGLSFTQLCGSAEGKITLETVLMHGSGQWISETLAFDLPDPIVTKDGKKKNNKAQDCGGIITYMRRYALSALLGIAQTDDDATQIQTISAKDLDELKDLILSKRVSNERINSWLARAKAPGLYMLPGDIAQKILVQLRAEEIKDLPKEVDLSPKSILYTTESTLTTPRLIETQELENLKRLLSETGKSEDSVKAYLQIEALEQITDLQYIEICKMLERKLAEKNKADNLPINTILQNPEVVN